MAAPRERDQPLVALQPEERRAPRKGGQRGVTVGERKLPCGQPWGTNVPRLGDTVAPEKLRSRTAGAPAAQLLEAVVGERDGHRALAHGPPDALHGPVAHVARREHARDARLERERVAIERPVVRPRAALSSRSGPVRMKPLPSVRTPLDWRPAGARHAADAEEQRRDRAPSRAPSRPPRSSPRRAGPPPRAARVTCAAQPDLDRSLRLDPVDEIGRHRLAEAVAAHHHRHPRARRWRGSSRPGPPSCRRPPPITCSPAHWIASLRPAP